MHQVIEGIVIIDYFPAETHYEAKLPMLNSLIIKNFEI